MLVIAILTPVWCITAATVVSHSTLPTLRAKTVGAFDAPSRGPVVPTALQLQPGPQEQIDIDDGIPLGRNGLWNAVDPTAEETDQCSVCEHVHQMGPSPPSPPPPSWHLLVGVAQNLREGVAIHKHLGHPFPCCHAVR